MTDVLSSTSGVRPTVQDPDRVRRLADALPGRVGADDSPRHGATDEGDGQGRPSGHIKWSLP